MNTDGAAYDKPRHPAVFLSSVFKDTFDDKFQDVPLRRRILENRHTLPVWLWAYEHYWPENSEKPDPEADTIIDRCFAGIKAADLFVFLLTYRHGSGVTYFGEDRTWSSYLELELFAAAALQKPIVVLHLRGREPDEPLRDAMHLLARAFAAGEYVIDDDDGLYRRFRELCEGLASRSLDVSAKPLLAQLPEWLSIQRTRSDPKDDLLDPRLEFLGGRFASTKPNANPDRAKRLLEQVSSGVRLSPDGSQGAMPHGAALFRLWSALRELMDAKDSTRSDPSGAVLWDRCFGLWASRASWFGLHGHLWMGPLASVNSQTALRSHFAEEPRFKAATDVREPLGARASAIYSVAQRMQSRSRRLYHYTQVLDLASSAIARDTGAHQGALSIRGHAQMQMALLGHFWKLWAALDDFKLSLDLRTKSGASPASIGEAMTDLGFCYVLTARRSRGLSLMKEGVSLLRDDSSPTGQAFLARGLRKLERGARFAGARGLTKQAHEERMALSAEIEALDQARP